MKTRQQKQNDLIALTEQFKNSTATMVMGFEKVTVSKDQEIREQLRTIGAQYRVVKNTIAKLASDGTPFENAKEHFKGMTAVAFSDGDAVVLSKMISKFVKENADFYQLKVGVVEGKVVNASEVQQIATLPSKEELISKFLFVINAQAQRLASVINAVPQNLAIVIKQVGEQKEQ